MYYGQKRETAVVILADADIILTTYHTLAADFAAKRSPIHEIAWYRIVLDEGRQTCHSIYTPLRRLQGFNSDARDAAHIIRRRATTFYRTVFDISAKFRWCLTGSPIQNMLEDIGALFTFIRAVPFDSMATFRRYIATPFDEGEERRALASERLGLLLDSVCLRRMRELLDLPDKRDRVRVLEFSKEEREQYELTKRVMIRAIRQRAGEVDKKRLFGMFQAQLQLRILSNHGTFQQPFSWTDRRNIQMEQEDALCSIGQSGNIQCSSCRQSLPILGTSRVYRGRFDQCAHVLCSECLDEEASCEGGVVSRCPLCYSNEFAQTAKEFDSAYPRREETRDDYFRPQGYSSKMEALIADIQEDLWDTKR
jgi:SWI/SNF-related matrix-associated actin-dependent regulator of chromatin subfamily A3